jgi:hypothetical protein
LRVPDPGFDEREVAEQSRAMDVTGRGGERGVVGAECDAQACP